METLTRMAALIFGQPAPVEEREWWCDCGYNDPGPCPGPDFGDAWESFDAANPAVRYSPRNPLAYMRTFHKFPMVGPQSVVIKSVNRKSTWHVFTHRTRP